LDFDEECKRLLKDIHYFDVLRSDRSISSHGLEARTPFLDRNFVQTYLSIPVQLRDHNAQGVCEKYLLRKTFDDKNLLPREVLWRTKEAFSDGVSSDKESWFETIQKQHSDEKMYYKRIFNQHYNNNEQVIPYYWMPNFVDATDASARTLDIYNKTSGEVTENNI
jgi:asparagine synthase (glutamine-hydrolysing)